MSDSQVSHLSGSDVLEAQETYEEIVGSKKSSYETIYFVPSEKLMVFEHVYENPSTLIISSYHGKYAHISFLVEPTIKTNSERTKYKLTYNDGEIIYFMKL